MVLNGGKIQQIESPLNLYNKPSNKFVASFIGSPQMNMLNATIKGNNILVDNNILAVISKELKEGLKVDEFSIGVRPEALALTNKEDKNGFKVKIDNVEFLGNETRVNFKIGGFNLVARWAGQINVNIGHEVYVKFDIKDFHFFNSITEERIELNRENSCR